MIDAVTVEQSEAFSILRRPQVESDRLSDVPGDYFSGGLIGRLGLNPALARRAPTAVGDVWVVPGNGYLGLHGGHTGADATEVVAQQGMMGWTSQDGKGIVRGLVPDGVSEVTLFWSGTLQDSEYGSTSVLVRDNVYGAVLDGYFRSLRFVGPTGAIELGPYG